jgi:hypothetical protein
MKLNAKPAYKDIEGEMEAADNMTFRSAKDLNTNVIDTA